MASGNAPRNRPKGQHWVPDFYLRYFSTPDTRDLDKGKQQVWVFSKHASDGEERLGNTLDVCKKRYLYTPIVRGIERDWELEAMLDGVEGLLGQVWKELAEGFVPLDDLAIRKAISLFVATMFLRNLETRKMVESMHRQLVAFLDTLPSRSDGTPDIETVVIENRAVPLEISEWHEYRSWSKNDHDRFFAQLVRSEASNIAEMMMEKRWSIVCGKADVFITSDKPVAIQHLTRPTVGFGTPGAMITFPLSPRHLLVMDDKHDEPANQYYALHANAAGAFNLNIWKNGSRFMITGRPVPDVLNEICAWANSLDADEVNRIG